MPSGDDLSEGKQHSFSGVICEDDLDDTEFKRLMKRFEDVFTEIETNDLWPCEVTVEVTVRER